MAPRPSNPRLALEILRVTAELVEQNGASGVTMRAVADRIGYSPTTIYLYFKNKEELLGETIERGFEWLSDAMNTATKSSSPIGRLRETSQAYVSWGLENPAMYRLMFEHPYFMDLDDPEEWAKKVERRRKPLRESRDRFLAAIEAGEISPDTDVDALVQLSWASLHGTVSLALSGRLMGPTHVLPEGVLANRVRELIDLAVDSWAALYRP